MELKVHFIGPFGPSFQASDGWPNSTRYTPEEGSLDSGCSRFDWTLLGK